MRASARSAWRQVGAPVPIVVGRSGLGWGRGLHGAGAPPGADGPGKAEGDGRSPAGVFLLTEAFGYAPGDSVRSGLPYRRATADLECVDDPASALYNRVVTRPAAPDYTSHEEMRRADDLYRVGVVVAHNDPAVPRGGSCIFLHQWGGPRSTTSGCTALAPAPLDALVAWLRPGAVLVQLPDAQYRRLRRPWRLP
jgi:L,D-peptidoglycan transpeptidase YkuD (ErfK/YbiS/YcfS/YnhG family)